MISIKTVEEAKVILAAVVDRKLHLAKLVASLLKEGLVDAAGVLDKDVQMLLKYQRELEEMTAPKEDEQKPREKPYKDD